MADETNLRLGEMLQSLGIVNRDQLNDAVRMAGEVALPIGRAMVLYGYLTQDQLNIALELQSLVKNKGLPLSVAIKAFQATKTQGIDLIAALQQFGFTGNRIASSNSRLGTLLLDSGLVSQEQLDLAQRASYETNLPIGRMLILMSITNETMVDIALEAQKAYREGQISYEQAIRRLNPNLESVQSTRTANKAVTTSTTDINTQKRIRLGELLMLSGILTESDIMNALEYGLTKQKPFGVILIELGLVTQSLLDLALNVQELVCQGTLSLQSATDTLYSYALTGRQQSDQGHGEKPAVRLGELLKLSGLVTDHDISQAISMSARYPSVIGKMLVLSGVIDEATLLAALRCQFLIKHQLISLEQAVEALKHSEQHKLSVDDSFDNLGIKLSSHF